MAGQPAFLAGLKTHMEGGGKVFLSGTAGKVLDLAIREAVQ